MIALANQFVELLSRQALVEIDCLDLDSMSGQETPGLAAGRSSRLCVELRFCHRQYLGIFGSIWTLQASMPPSIETQLATPCLRSQETVLRLRMPW